MAVAFIALLVALGGTAYAAFGPFKGDKIIKKHSLSGNRLKNHTLSAKQVQSASTANNANNANALGGQPPSAFVPTSHVVNTGMVRVTAAVGGNTVTLAQSGPFTIKGTCTDMGGGNFEAKDTVSSSEANTIIDGTLVPTANTPSTALSTVTDTVVDTTDDAIEAQAPSGQDLNLAVVLGVHSISDCFFDVQGLHR